MIPQMWEPCNWHYASSKPTFKKLVTLMSECSFTGTEETAEDALIFECSFEDWSKEESAFSFYPRKVTNAVTCVILRRIWVYIIEHPPPNDLRRRTALRSQGPKVRRDVRVITLTIQSIRTMLISDHLITKAQSGQRNRAVQTTH